MKIGVPLSHMISPVKPEEILAAGTDETVITIGEETVVQLLLLVTATVILSPVTKSVREIVFVVAEAPRLTLFLKNS